MQEMAQMDLPTGPTHQTSLRGVLEDHLLPSMELHGTRAAVVNLTPLLMGNLV